MKAIIGKRIRKIRESRDYSQENVAEDLGVSKSTYAKIERGEIEASATKLIKIAEILDVQVAEFFADIQQPAVNQLNDPARLYGFATKSDIEELVKMIHAIGRDVEHLKTRFNNLDQLSRGRKK